MEIKHPPELRCLSCGKALPLNRRDEDVGLSWPDVFEAQCHECKAIYRLRVATYRQAEN